MADLDVKTANKQAEFETLSRATAALLEQHEKLREDFDNELRQKAEKAEADLVKSLKKERKELDKLTSEVIKQQELSGKLTIDSADKVKALTEQDKRLTREKLVITEIIVELTADKKVLEGDARLLRAEKEELAKDILTKREELTSLHDKIGVAENKLGVLDLQIEEKTVEYNFNKTAYDKEEEDSKHRLAQINSQLNTASRSLHEVKVEEDNIRTDLANLSMQLDKRQQVIENREMKVAQQEKRVFNYSKFTSL